MRAITTTLLEYFWVGREHKMPELEGGKKNHITVITLFHLVPQPIQIQPAVDI